MINENLHRQPVALDRDQHRQLRLPVPATEFGFAAELNSVFVAAAEFTDVCREYPIVFVRAGQDDKGKPLVAPIAVLGLVQAQNLFVDGGKWRSQYMPALLRAYPFCIGRVNAEQFVICADMAWSGASAGSGERVFEDDGQPTQLLKNVQTNLEVLEAEIQRTRLVCEKLVELDLLRDMRFDATLQDGRKHSVDGFLTVDDTKMQNLSDAVVGELHRGGVLGYVHLHWNSLPNMRRLVNWFVERNAATAPAVAANDAVAPNGAA